MRKALMLAVGASLTFAGSALAFPYYESTDLYTLNGAVTPFKSGTAANPQPADIALSYDVDTNPSGSRPGITKGVTIGVAGLTENSLAFPACSTAQLATGPKACPAGSYVGSGFIVFQEGPSDATNSSLDNYCSVDTQLFNAANHKLSLYITEGAGQGDYDPCVLPGDAPVTVNVSMVSAVVGGRSQLGWVYSLPPSVLHPAANTDASVVHQELTIPHETTPVTTTTTVTFKVTKTKTRFVTKTVGKGKKRHHIQVKKTFTVTTTVTKLVHTTHRVGLFNTNFCPASGQRQVAANFSNEDSVNRTVSLQAPCSP